MSRRPGARPRSRPGRLRLRVRPVPRRRRARGIARRGDRVDRQLRRARLPAPGPDRSRGRPLEGGSRAGPGRPRPGPRRARARPPRAGGRGGRGRARQRALPRGRRGVGAAGVGPAGDRDRVLRRAGSHGALRRHRARARRRHGPYGAGCGPARRGLRGRALRAEGAEASARRPAGSRDAGAPAPARLCPAAPDRRHALARRRRRDGRLAHAAGRGRARPGARFERGQDAGRRRRRPDRLEALRGRLAPARGPAARAGALGPALRGRRPAPAAGDHAAHAQGPARCRPGATRPRLRPAERRAGARGGARPLRASGSCARARCCSGPPGFRPRPSSPASRSSTSRCPDADAKPRPSAAARSPGRSPAAAARSR